MKERIAEIHEAMLRELAGTDEMKSLEALRVKVLGKAAFDTVFRLARALHVPPQSIVEPL